MDVDANVRCKNIHVRVFHTNYFAIDFDFVDKNKAVSAACCAVTPSARSSTIRIFLRHGFVPTARFVLSHGALSLMLLGKYLVLAAESIWSKERRALFMYMYVNLYIFAVGYYK